MEIVSKARRMGFSAALLAASVAGLQVAGAAIGAQRSMQAQPNTQRRQHDHNTGPKHTPRKDNQDRLAAAEAKRQRRAARNLAIGQAGGIQFA